MGQSWEVPGIDYGCKYAPSCRVQIVRMAFAIAARGDQEVLEVNVQTAFLDAEVQDEVYVKTPTGYESLDVPTKRNSRRAFTDFVKALATGSTPPTTH